VNIEKILENKDWTFAKTMPYIPHWWSRRIDWKDDSLFNQVVMYIRDKGKKQTFGKKNYIYYYAGIWKYWTMGNSLVETEIINRAKAIKSVECKYQEISFIPKTYKNKLEYATFVERQKPEVWFKAYLEKSDKIIGCGSLCILSKQSVRHSNDFVIPEYRNNGVIKKIVRAREKWSKKNNFKKAEVKTVKKYYQIFGYKKIKEYKTGDWLWEKSFEKKVSN